MLDLFVKKQNKTLVYLQFFFPYRIIVIISSYLSKTSVLAKKSNITGYEVASLNCKSLCKFLNVSSGQRQTT